MRSWRISLLDGADLVLDLAAAVRGLLYRLLGRLGRPADYAVGVGPRAGPDLVRFGLGLSGWLLLDRRPAAPRGGNRRKTTTNAPNARAKATSPITKSASAPLTVTPSVPLVTGLWRYVEAAGHGGRWPGAGVRVTRPAPDNVSLP